MMPAAELVARLVACDISPELLTETMKALFAGEAAQLRLAERHRVERERKARSRANAARRDSPRAAAATEGDCGVRPKADADVTGQDVTGRDVTFRSVTSRDLAGDDAALCAIPAEKAAMSRDVALRHVTARDVTLSTPSPNKSPPDPQKLTPTPVCARRARARAAGEAGYHRLPEGWTPTRPLPPSTRAKVDQWPPGMLDDELDALHRWAANAKDEAGRGRKRDWDKAWVNWIERRHDERFGRAGSAKGRAARRHDGDGLSATTRAALRVFGPIGDDDEAVPQRPARLAPGRW